MEPIKPRDWTEQEMDDLFGVGATPNPTPKPTAENDRLQSDAVDDLSLKYEQGRCQAFEEAAEALESRGCQCWKDPPFQCINCKHAAVIRALAKAEEQAGG